jgi:hypothetical protein
MRRKKVNLIETHTQLFQKSTQGTQSTKKAQVCSGIVKSQKRR